MIAQTFSTAFTTFRYISIQSESLVKRLSLTTSSAYLWISPALAFHQGAGD